MQAFFEVFHLGAYVMETTSRREAVNVANRLRRESGRAGSITRFVWNRNQRRWIASKVAI
jgi:hypothetical protein